VLVQIIMDLRKIKRKGKGHGRGKHAKIDSFVWSLEEDIALLSQAQFPASKVSVRDQYGTTAVTRTITNRIEVLKKKSAALREFLTKDLTEVREHVHDLAVKHAEKRRAGDIASETRQDSAFQQQLNTEDATAVRSKRSRNRHKDFLLSKESIANAAFPHVLTNSDRGQSPLRLPYDGTLDLQLPGSGGERQPRLPPGALVHPSSGRASIPEEWSLLIAVECFELESHQRPPLVDYTVMDVSRTTPIAQLIESLKSFLHLAPSVPLFVVEVTDAATGAHRVLNPLQNAREVDLFNISTSILVTTLPTLGNRRAASMISAANTAPSAPPHVEMTNNILGASGDTFGDQTQLVSIDKRDWTRLKKHMIKINESPSQMCYNVSFLMFLLMLARCSEFTVRSCARGCSVEC
jgi:hypothetical protein